MEKDEIISSLLVMNLEDYEDLQIEFRQKIQDHLDLLIKEYKDVFNKFINERSSYFKAKNKFVKALDKYNCYNKLIDSRQTYNKTHPYNTRSKKENLKPKKEPVDENCAKIQDKYMVQLRNFNEQETQYTIESKKLKQRQLIIKQSCVTLYKKLHGSNADMKPMEKELKNYIINNI